MVISKSMSLTNAEYHAIALRRNEETGTMNVGSIEWEYICNVGYAIKFGLYKASRGTDWKSLLATMVCFFF